MGNTKKLQLKLSARLGYEIKRESLAKYVQIFNNFEMPIKYRLENLLINEDMFEQFAILVDTVYRIHVGNQSKNEKQVSWN